MFNSSSSGNRIMSRHSLCIDFWLTKFHKVWALIWDWSCTIVPNMRELIWVAAGCWLLLLMVSLLLLFIWIFYVIRYATIENNIFNKLWKCAIYSSQSAVRIQWREVLINLKFILENFYLPTQSNKVIVRDCLVEVVANRTFIFRNCI